MMQVTFNDSYSINVNEASESYINHVKQFWCKINFADNIDIDQIRQEYLYNIPTEKVTSIKLYNEETFLFELTGTYSNIEINKFYFADRTCFVTITLRKEIDTIGTLRGNEINEESDA